MVVSTSEDPAHGDALQVGLDSFERVETFKNLGVLIDHKNSLDPEIRARCLAGLSTFHSLARGVYHLWLECTHEFVSIQEYILDFKGQFRLFFFFVNVGVNCE